MAPSRATEVTDGLNETPVRHGTLAVECTTEASPQPFWTFEFFPPKTSVGYRNLVERLERMASLRPAWVHITWGAGGSTHERSLELAEAALALGLPVCLHLTCTNMERRVLDETLQRARVLGIRRILALRGDEPRDEEYVVAADTQFQHAVDLVRYIKRHHGDVFSVGVAGYPEGHIDAQDLAKEISYLRDKVDAGADFVVTQLFYDVDGFLKWYRACRRAGISVPILPGIMPIQNYQSFRRMTTLCKSVVPADVSDALAPIETDDQRVKDYGIELATRMIQQIRSQENSISGFNLCTLNLEKSVRRILDNLQWTPAREPRNASAKPLRANGTAGPHVRTHSMEARPGPATWDEFPNGRFGDARSPAYGEMDGWGVSLKLTAAEALHYWGRPTSTRDISAVFAAYLRGEIPGIAWSDEPLRLESSAILNDLIALNQQKGWWTVGSQPAVDGVPSTDRAFGFGPKGGYVYQKAFVEFFCPKAEVDGLARRAEETNQRADARKITYFAGGRAAGDFRTNMGRGEVNAVTWGVFPGQDLVTSTYIEEMNFKAWKEEAFDIWDEWERLYPVSSSSRQLLRDTAEDRWLVSIVDHDYKDGRGLWEWLGLHGST